MQGVRFAGLARVPASDRLVGSSDEPELAIALRHSGINGGGLIGCARVRMIMADDRQTASARGPVRRKQHGRVNLEAMVSVGSNVGGRTYLHDLRGAVSAFRDPQQQPATFVRRRNARKSADILQ